MRGWRIRWLLLGVSALVLILPALSLIALRSYSVYLIRQTEERLIGESVVIGEAYREAWLREGKLTPDSFRPPDRVQARYTPVLPLAERLTGFTEPEPETFPERVAGSTEEARAGHAVEQMLQRAQVFNLSAARVLDSRGCVVATTGGDVGCCLGELPEVRSALQGKYSAVLRERMSEDPTPPIGGISRRGDQRLFTALPLYSGHRVIGVVRMSRTAESGLEWLWKNRRLLVGAMGLVVGAAFVLSLVCATLIARPVEQMAKAASAIARSGIRSEIEVTPRAPHEVLVLGQALQAMMSKLEQRADYVNEFAANVSHELRTPLTTIRGAIELLRDGWETMEPAQRQRFLESIEAAARRTETLVDSLLRLTRIENPSAQNDAPGIRLGDFKAQLELAHPKHVSVEVDDPESTVAIPIEHLHSAVGNLVDNALRYRRTDPVRVRLRKHEGRLHVSVRDDGSGISAANRAKIFDRFFTTERDRGGTGLGLSIVRAIADARGGSIDCDSGEGGTEFLLVL